MQMHLTRIVAIISNIAFAVLLKADDGLIFFRVPIENSITPQLHRRQGASSFETPFKPPPPPVLFFSSCNSVRSESDLAFQSLCSRIHDLASEVRKASLLNTQASFPVEGAVKGAPPAIVEDFEGLLRAAGDLRRMAEGTSTVKDDLRGMVDDIRSAKEVQSGGSTTISTTGVSEEVFVDVNGDTDAAMAQTKEKREARPFRKLLKCAHTKACTLLAVVLEAGLIPAKGEEERFYGGGTKAVSATNPDISSESNSRPPSSDTSSFSTPTSSNELLPDFLRFGPTSLDHVKGVQKGSYSDDGSTADSQGGDSESEAPNILGQPSASALREAIRWTRLATMTESTATTAESEGGSGKPKTNSTELNLAFSNYATLCEVHGIAELNQEIKTASLEEKLGAGRSGHGVGSDTANEEVPSLLLPESSCAHWRRLAAEKGCGESMWRAGAWYRTQVRLLNML